MALTYSKQILSGSTNGRMIEVNASASPGTTVHTVQATATTSREEVYLSAMNSATANAIVTIEWGGTGTADQIVDTIAPNSGLRLLVNGISLTATSSIVRAFATATGLLRVIGHVNRVTNV